jgi:uncharacterized protein YndB with AHSA1/START domain
MTARHVTHATFTIERLYDASPEQVFRACSDPAIKRQWFAEGESWMVESYDLDFRVGGIEASQFKFRGGERMRYDALYQDIVPNQRIIAAYSMMIGDNRISASLATTELTPAGNGTRLIFTEQGAYLDGFDNVEQREAGTRELFESLSRALERETA